MTAKFILKIDEAFEILTDNLDKLPQELHNELDNICYPIDDDIAYIMADLIRDKRNKKSWELRRSKDGDLFMPLEEPHKELKHSVFIILNENKIIDSFTSKYQHCQVVA